MDKANCTLLSSILLVLTLKKINNFHFMLSFIMKVVHRFSSFLFVAGSALSIEFRRNQSSYKKKTQESTEELHNLEEFRRNNHMYGLSFIVICNFN